jgi:hypothetical protein
MRLPALLTAVLCVSFSVQAGPTISETEIAPPSRKKKGERAKRLEKRDRNRRIRAERQAALEMSTVTSAPQIVSSPPIDHEMFGLRESGELPPPRLRPPQRHKHKDSVGSQVLTGMAAAGSWLLSGSDDDCDGNDSGNHETKKPAPSKRRPDSPTRGILDRR